MKGTHTPGKHWLLSTLPLGTQAQCAFINSSVLPCLNMALPFLFPGSLISYGFLYQHSVYISSSLCFLVFFIKLRQESKHQPSYSSPCVFPPTTKPTMHEPFCLSSLPSAYQSKAWAQGLERWLSGPESWLQFSALTELLTTIQNSNPRSALFWHPRAPCTHEGTDIQTSKALIHIKKI